MPRRRLPHPLPQGHQVHDRNRSPAPPSGPRPPSGEPAETTCPPRQATPPGPPHVTGAARSPSCIPRNRTARPPEGQQAVAGSEGGSRRTTFSWACVTGELLAARTRVKINIHRHRAMSVFRLGLDHQTPSEHAQLAWSGHRSGRLEVTLSAIHRHKGRRLTRRSWSYAQDRLASRTDFPVDRITACVRGGAGGNPAGSRFRDVEDTRYALRLEGKRPLTL